LMVTDISHLGIIPSTMMTVFDNSNQKCKFFSIASKERKLIETSFPTITNREKQVIRLMANGFTSKEIAEKLHLAFYTVENHKRNLRTKTNTKSAAELMNYLLINNLF
jgi:DNA-binding NarL/FixJ family response regulator